MDQKNNPISESELENELKQLPSEQGGELLHTWALLGEAAPQRRGAVAKDVLSLDEAWHDLEARIESGGTRSDRPARRSASYRKRGRLVAVALALCAVALGLWVWQLPVAATAPAGEQHNVTLADGSIVHLNSGTQLRYRPRALPLLTDRRRFVELSGEAFFEVVPAEHPFIVQTADAVVEVLGTTFNVRAFAGPHDGATEVTLASGRVRVGHRRRPQQDVVLSEPGKSVRVEVTADSALVTKSATLDHVLAWRRDAFAAVDRPVALILHELERRYDVSIQVEEGVAVEDSMTLLYGPGINPERILHDICLVQGCRYRPTSRGFAVFAPNGPATR